eukprot:m.195084 g.195084  ORF g.195084 m.195084 type:complete len:143 (+) comp10625_c0_seq10:1055-1483(+)
MLRAHSPSPPFPALQDGAVRNIVVGCNLLSLDLSGCLISDLSLHHIALNLPHLENLSLADCPKLTDKGAQYLTAEQGCTRLTSLDIRNLPFATDSLCRLVSANPGLVHLWMANAPNVDDSVISALAATCSSLKSLEFVDWRA